MKLRVALFNKVQSQFFYGWVILAVATISMFASGPGQSHTFSIFVDLIARDLGISSTSIASSYAFATMISALGLSRMGWLVDRFGTRRVMLVVVVCLGLACLGFGAAVGVVSLSLGFMFLRFFGQGSLMLGSSNLVAQWFDVRRGFAMSVMMLGFSASMAFHPTLAQWLIDQVGWREAWIWLGVMTWILLLPLFWFLVHDRPEAMGLQPDGAIPSNAADQMAGATALTGLPLKAAMRTPAFWIIAAGLFTPAMLITSLFFFQVSIFEQHGLGRSLATSMFGVSALSMAVSMPAIGWALDHTNPKYVFSASLTLLAISLVSITFVENTVTAIGYAVIFGINTAANMTFFGYMWARYFGRKFLGSIQGAGQTIGVVGASIGPIPLALAFDSFGAYDGALHILAIIPLTCSVLALFLVAPKLPDPNQQE